MVGGDIRLSDDATIFGTISSSGGMQIRSRIGNADMYFRGVDDGTESNALTLDMSASGNATFAGDVNINSVFDFNTSSDLLTITNNQNTGGINFSGGNSRIYFGGYRAIEGDQSGGTLYIHAISN